MPSMLNCVVLIPLVSELFNHNYFVFSSNKSLFKFVEIVRVHSFIKDEIVQYYLIYKSVWEI